MIFIFHEISTSILFPYSIGVVFLICAVLRLRNASKNLQLKKGTRIYNIFDAFVWLILTVFLIFVLIEISIIVYRKIFSSS